MLENMKPVPILLVALVLLVFLSGCSDEALLGKTPNNNNNNQPPSENVPPENTEEVPVETPIEETPVEEPEIAVEPPVEQPFIIPGTQGSFRSPYDCDDPALVGSMKSLFGQNAEVLRRPAPFGKSISYVSCNVREDGTILFQVEFHETTTLQSALDSMEDEAIQSTAQLFGSVKRDEQIGQKGYLIFVPSNNETRIFFVDNDPGNSVFVITKSIPNSGVTEETARQVALTLEKII